MGRFALCLFVFCFISTNLSQAKRSGEPVSDFTFEKPVEGELGKKYRLWATRYYLPVYKYTTTEKYPLLDMQGKELGPKLSHKDWCMGALEGSLLLKYKDNSVKAYNYDGFAEEMQVDCKKFFKYVKSGRMRFREATGPYGDGAEGTDYILFPYRSIAVDSNIIPFGTVLYIPEARGKKITLKTGKKFVHDGFFFAADMGGAIKDIHIDVFEGVESLDQFDSFVKSTIKYKFSAYVVKNQRIIDLMEKAHLIESGVLVPGEF
jgi:3D (Asp-Asp-Asp) domain-containing protein